MFRLFYGSWALCHPVFSRPVCVCVCVCVCVYVCVCVCVRVANSSVRKVAVSSPKNRQKSSDDACAQYAILREVKFVREYKVLIFCCYLVRLAAQALCEGRYMLLSVEERPLQASPSLSEVHLRFF